MLRSLRSLFKSTSESNPQSVDLSELADSFDEIICLSLPSCVDRREHIRRHFKAVGIKRYRFFDAICADAPVVEEHYWNERVQRYPECFRCQKLECENDDCNNVLIPSQVATWLTHQAAWELIRDQGWKNALIVEDDILFNNHAPLVLKHLVATDEFRQNFQSDHPCLLRLGWKLQEDHEYHGTVELSSSLIRLSNPCYAINRAMAAALVDQVKKVDTTVDIYVHRQVAPQYHHYTVVPPLAHEHSASTGEMASLIHPKKRHVKYLMRQRADKAEIRAAKQRMEQHVHHAIIRDVLCVGHPRCGSGYMSHLLEAFDLKVGHERMEADGISSWMFAVDDASYPYGKGKYARSRRYTHFRHLIHHVRSPMAAIPSLIVENQHSELSFEFRRKHIQRHFGIDLASFGPVDAAVASFIYWSRIIELMKPELTIRIEDGQAELFEFLKRVGLIHENRTFEDVKSPPKTVNTRKPYKGKIIEKPVLNAADWCGISDFLKSDLKQYCETYQYTPPVMD